MRISDWSSDVCSSDLAAGLLVAALAYAPLRRAPPTSFFIATIAVGLIVQHGVTAGIGPEPRIGPPLIDAGVLRIGGIGLAHQQLATIATAAEIGRAHV